MGSSAKKRNDKKKDFQKPKLRVGKSRPKATNTTDTTFRSKGIIVRDQTLSIDAPSLSSQTERSLSLLSSRSDSQRKDSLSHLSAIIANRTIDQPLQISCGFLLPKLLPLILDGNDGVRTQLLRTLRALRASEIEDYAERILLYVRAGMTHLATGIRESSMDLLSWAIGMIGAKLVACPGGWIKTLKYFATMLGWPLILDKRGSSKPTPTNSHKENKLTVKALTNLTDYLRCGLVATDARGSSCASTLFPISFSKHYLHLQRAGLYSHLNLFGFDRDEDAEMYSERENRQKACLRHVKEPLHWGLTEMKKSGGDIGRVAAVGDKILEEETVGFELSMP